MIDLRQKLAPSFLPHKKQSETGWIPKKRRTFMLAETDRATSQTLSAEMISRDDVETNFTRT